MALPSGILALPLVSRMRDMLGRIGKPPGNVVKKAGTLMAQVASALVVPLSATFVGVHGFTLWSSCFLGWMLVVLAWVDIRHLLLPDIMTLPLLVVGLSESWLWHPAQLIDRAIGAMLGYACLACTATLYRRYRGQEGLGAGDAKLLAAGGAWVGWPLLPDILLASGMLGILWVLLRAASGKGQVMTARALLPFGPCLAIGIWTAWLWRQSHL